ncbi:MAG: hypothetical protein JWN18_574 [Parcubacteria group bacterium]|nr:hypothetical protein [Parcubacteria group bacterium]
MPKRSKRKPSCHCFILAALQQTRSKGGRSTSYAGLALWKIFALAKVYYSEAEFRTALRNLMTSGQLIVTATIYTGFPNGSSPNDSWYTGAYLDQLTSIPKDVPLNATEWQFDGRMRYFDPTKKTKKCMSRTYSILLYVAADGLPQATKIRLRWKTRDPRTLRELAAPKTIAESIMDSLMDNRTD